jgi:DNA-binding NarL/FixJ family response regulator
VIQDIETEVHLSLVPAVDVDPLRRPPAELSAAGNGAIAATTLSPLRVLIVDDAPSTRRFLRAVLEHCSDFDVVGEAADGDTAIEQADALQPDLVLLDLSMPTVDGAHALKGILGVAPKAIVIVVSGIDSSVSGMMLDAGAAAFVPKGITPYDLLDRLGSILDRPITLRQSGSGDTDQASELGSAGLRSPNQSDRRAVVLENDPTVRHLITEALMVCDVEVVAEASTPSTLLAVIDLAQPELVVLDLALKGAPDTAILTDVCRRSPRSVVVVYSDFDDWKDRAISAGAAAFIRKPRIEELTDRIRQLTSSR